MDAENIVSKYYRLMNLSPGRKAASFSVLSLIIVVISLATSFPASRFYSFFENLLIYFMEALALVLLHTPLRITRVFNLKRAVNFTVAILLATLPAEIVLSRLTGFRGLGVSLSPGFSIFVFSAFYKVRTAVMLSLYSAISVPLLIETLSLGYGVFYTVLPVLSMSLASLGAGIAALYSIEYLGRGRGISPLNSVRAFMKAWLTGESEPLEEFIQGLGISGRVRVRTLVFKREFGEPIVLVFPDFHFGPFRNAGSSRFIYFLEENLRPAAETLVFHTPGSHERNIATASESMEIAKSVASSVISYHGYLVDYGMCRPRTQKSGEWELHILRGPTAIVGFLTNTVQGNDDLPYSIWEKAENLVNEDPQLSLLVIVDSHAAKGPPFKNGEELTHAISSLKDANKCSEEEFYVGYGEATGTGCRELCYDKVKVLTLRFGNDRYALVYLYGNNVDIRTRESIVNIMESMGYKGTIVVTPDDHSCAASFKEKPYHVITGCPGLYEAISRAAERALESEYKARYVTLEQVFDGVKLAGQNIWKLISLVDELGKVTLYVLMLLIIFINLIAIPVILVI